MASALALAHIEGQRRLRLATMRGVAGIWDGLPGHDHAQLDQWLSKVLPLTESAKRASVNLTHAYIARAIERPPAAIDAQALIAGLRNGTSPEEVYSRPFVTLWSGLKEGKLWADAAAMGLDRATGAAAMDVQLAMRGTLDAMQRAEPSIYGYQRVADGSACDYCLEIDGAYVYSGDAFPLHNHCGCGVEPLIFVHDRAVRLPDGTEIRDYQYGPLKPEALPEGVAVEHHGELGPVLVDPHQHFMDQAEALAR